MFVRTQKGRTAFKTELTVSEVAKREERTANTKLKQAQRDNEMPQKEITVNLCKNVDISLIIETKSVWTI